MTSINLPEVTDNDIAWVVEMLNLPKDAFSPIKDGGAREKILKSVGETWDVSACPGSGKTTLLVAKLAILSRNWSYRRKGVCVLSHTNVAKDEIEKRLGGTEVGQALLSYPNYIGTIHGFVNDYLALPWLRAKGYPIKIIDDDIVNNLRYGIVKSWNYKSLSGYVTNKKDPLSFVQSWMISSGKFDVTDKSGVSIFKNPGPSNDELSDLVKQVVQDGYHRHGEMFTWANDLIDQLPSVTKYIRDRFPLLFLDEVQDNSEMQTSMLYRIFMGSDNSVSRLRFGDSDQEIFDYVGESNKTVTDSFPSDCNDQVISLPNSHRFGPSIAKLASPLSVGKVTLVGQGPKGGLGEDRVSRHAIFLVDDDSVDQILEVYGRYLLSVFDKDQRDLDNMIFTAVGAVHRNNGDNHKPRHVAHYWGRYDPSISTKDPTPSTFLQYVTAGHHLAENAACDGAGGESFAAVERVAMGVLHFVRTLSAQFNSTPRKRSHRFILDLLTDDLGLLDSYLMMVTTFAVERALPSEECWNRTWKPVVIDVVSKIAGDTPKEDASFLAYPVLLDIDHNQSTQARHNNIYSVEHEGRRANIRLGSIHSVKGETHTATLVLETYNRAHHLDKVYPQIKGKQIGSANSTMDYRLKLHYVAMTRPSHLLCLAMMKSTFEDKRTGKIKQKEIDALKKHGWGNVGLVNSNGECNWL